MKKRVAAGLSAALVLACAFTASPGCAQSGAMPRPPEALLKMREAFATAARAGDAEAAARLSRFPLDNPAARGGRSLTRAAFIKRFKEDFTRQDEIVYCWQNSNLEMEYRDGQSNFRIWHLACGANNYGFALIGIHWLYTGYESR
jgi:hypothetical protein